MTDATDHRPSALERLDEILDRAAGRPIMLFLDFDGTLAPIVPRPEQAALAPGMADALLRARERVTLAVISGRGLEDVRRRVGIDGIAYAGSHGFEIRDPDGRLIEYEQADRFLPALDRAEAELASRLSAVDGVIVERKRFAIAIHYRLAAEHAIPEIESAIDAALSRHAELAKAGGKKIFEIRPRVDWHKGKAVLWLLHALHGDAGAALPVYIGDDVTDEDAFAALRSSGVGIRVGPPDAPTAAAYVLADVGQVRAFLDALLDRLGRG